MFYLTLFSHMQGMLTSCYSSFTFHFLIIILFFPKVHLVKCNEKPGSEDLRHNSKVTAVGVSPQLCSSTQHRAQSSLPQTCPAPAQSAAGSSCTNGRFWHCATHRKICFEGTDPATAGYPHWVSRLHEASPWPEPHLKQGLSFPRSQRGSHGSWPHSYPGVISSVRPKL